MAPIRERKCKSSHLICAIVEQRTQLQSERTLLKGERIAIRSGNRSLLAPTKHEVESNLHMNKNMTNVKINVNLQRIVAVGAIALAQSAVAEGYEFENVDPNGAGEGVWSLASGINNRGQIAGHYIDTSFIFHAYVWDGRDFVEVFDPEALPLGTMLAAINDHGVFVGGSLDFPENADPWGWSQAIVGVLDKEIVTFPNLAGLDRFFAFGINNSGALVGTYGRDEEASFFTPNNLNGFLLDGETLYDIAPPDASWTVASIINDHGQIVGEYADTNGVIHGFHFDDGAYTRIDFPGAAETHALGMNNRGTIIGYYADTPGGLPHGFVLKQGEFMTLDHPNSIGTRANGMNDKGEIVGNYLGTDGLFHGFKASPVKGNRK